MKVGVTPARASPLLWVLIGVLWMASLPLRPLFDPDEGRYAEIPREMLAHGDWVTPTLNGVKYFEKPPLQYWATAAVYSVFGVHAWTSRLWSLLLAFACIPLVYRFTRRIGYPEETAQIAATLLAINPYFAITGQLNLLDPGFTFFLSGAVFGFVLAQLQPHPSSTARNYMLVTWLCLALAVLSKGIVALVLAGGTLVAYMLLARDWGPLRRLHLTSGVPLFLAVTVPWFWLVQSRNPEFAQFFFIHEHFARYLTDEANRTEPWWYFFAILLIALLPLIWNFRRWDLLRRESAQPPAQFRTRLFLLIFCVLVFIFFSVSRSKLAPYILPLMPALAVLLAPATAGDKGAHWRATATLLALFLLLTVLMVAGSWRRFGGVSSETIVWAAAMLAPCIAALAMMFRKNSPAPPARRWVSLAAISVAGFQLLSLCYASAFPQRSGAQLVAGLVRPLAADTRLYSVGEFRPSIAFYLGRTFQVYGYSGELDFGLERAGVNMAERDRAEFLRKWRDEKDALAIIDSRMFPALGAQDIPGRVVARDGKSVVVSRS